jgi:hypothetical protein
MGTAMEKGQLYCVDLGSGAPEVECVARVRIPRSAECLGTEWEQYV